MRAPVCCLASLLFAATAGAQASFLSILPPGQDGFVPSTGGGAGPHAGDQRAMYDALIRAVPGITNADLPAFFKDAAIAPPASPESTVTPRPGVEILRDAFGVPHVLGDTRADVFFGAGYATAQDRLFFADVLRHMGRGRLSEFVGGALGLDATIGFDRTYYDVAGHSEAELQAIVDELLPGKRVQPDDNLFETGVSSMALVQIHERIDREFPGQVELAELFDHPTIGDLARHLESRLAGASSA